MCSGHSHITPDTLRSMEASKGTRTNGQKGIWPYRKHGHGHCQKFCWNLRQVSGEKFGHTKSTDTIVSEDLGHLLVGVEELFVLGVLEVVLFDVSPELLNAFGTAGFFLADDVSELSTELHGFGKSGSLRHVDRV